MQRAAFERRMQLESDQVLTPCPPAQHLNPMTCILSLDSRFVYHQLFYILLQLEQWQAAEADKLKLERKALAKQAKALEIQAAQEKTCVIGNFCRLLFCFVDCTFSRTCLVVVVSVDAGVVPGIGMSAFGRSCLQF